MLYGGVNLSVSCKGASWPAMDTRRLILATLLSAAVLIGFDYFFPQAL